MILEQQTVMYAELSHLPLKLTDQDGLLPSTNMALVLASIRMLSHTKNGDLLFSLSIAGSRAKALPSVKMALSPAFPARFQSYAGRLHDANLGGPALFP